MFYQCTQYKGEHMPKIIDVCQVSTNKRITLPQKVMEKLNLRECESSVLISEVDGMIVLSNAEA